MATKKAAVKRTPVRKQRVSLNLPDFNDYNQDGEYFHAIVKGQRIAGEIEYHSEDEIDLHNQQGVGEENECDNPDDSAFGHALYINPSILYDDDGDCIDGEFDWEAEFIKQGVEEFTIVKDRRLIKIINDTKMAGFHEWAVRVNDEGEAVFGCGAVTLDVDQMNTFLEGRAIEEERRDLEGQIEDLEREMDDLDNKMGDIGYNRIVDEIRDHMDPENIDTDEVVELIERIEKVNNTDIDAAISKVKVVKRR